MAAGGEVDLLAEAEALGVAPEEDDDEDLGGTTDQCDLAGSDDPGNATEGGGPPPPDEHTLVAPRYAVGQQVQVLRDSGSYASCEILAADRTEMGPMYAVRFTDGFVQSLLREEELAL
mmetsp:Transcript_122830/g.393476  ORF Transcript_122830/g.393476 Transcript_122830/m.393476 type:complete len:118 (-) Transcript_122830:189-542(-)